MLSTLWEKSERPQNNKNAAVLSCGIFVRVRSRYLFPPGSRQTSVETVYDRYHCK